jgi:carbon-monoxide dehydrogenase medium subunit
VLEHDSSVESAGHAAQLASEAARPIDDIRGSAAYRKAMVRVLARRGIEAVLAALSLTSVPPAVGGQA